MSREQDKQAIEALHHGQHCYIVWFEDGGGEVYRIWDTLILFEIPLYGGKGSHAGTFHINEVNKLLDLAHSWT
jgi:hypothetical protein